MSQQYQKPGHQPAWYWSIVLPSVDLVCSINHWSYWSLALNHQYAWINSLRPKRNRRHFADNIFKCIFLNENVWILITVSLKFVPKGPINNIPAVVQIMAWHRPGDKPLSEPMMIISLTHICVTRPQWVNGSEYESLTNELQWNLFHTNSFSVIKCEAVVSQVITQQRYPTLALNHQCILPQTWWCRATNTFGAVTREPSSCGSRDICDN